MTNSKMAHTGRCHRSSNACAVPALPGFWGAVRPLHVVFLLHMYIPPSYSDGYQRKALLQRPRVHHGFHVQSFLAPVLGSNRGRHVTHCHPAPACTPKGLLLGAPCSTLCPILLPWVPSPTAPLEHLLFICLYKQNKVHVYQIYSKNMTHSIFPAFPPSCPFQFLKWHTFNLL